MNGFGGVIKFTQKPGFYKSDSTMESSLKSIISGEIFRFQYVSLPRQFDTKHFVTMNRSYKTLYFFTILFLGIVSNTIAQPTIQWEETNHNFGEVIEGDKAVHEFSFTNTGDQPLVISRVQASCGCTTPFWTREPVMPGDKGVIKASYNSQGRPGNFRKSITVTSNAATPTSAVFIQGVVTKRPPTAEEIAASSKIVVEQTTAKTGKIEQGQSVPVAFEVANEGKAPLAFSNLRSNCNCVFFDPEFNRTIGSGENQTLKLIYTPAQTGKWVEVVTLYTNDVANREMKVTISAEVVETLAEEGMGSRRGF
ncbi:MAG: DUF1573 domain-containing protein [Bacteroidota bacterium]